MFLSKTLPVLILLSMATAAHAEGTDVKVEVGEAKITTPKKQKGRVVTIEPVLMTGDDNIEETMQKKFGISYSTYLVAAKTGRCRMAPKEHREECEILGEYFLNKAAEHDDCDQTFSDRDMQKKCRETLVQALKVGHGPNLLKDYDRKQKVWERLKELSRQACLQITKQKDQDKCLKANSESEDVLEYQEKCYSECMPKKFREQCLQVDKFGEDHVLSREIRAHAYIGQCRFITNEEYKSECEKFSKIMIKYEATNQSCGHFVTEFMRDQCETMLKQLYPDQNVGDASGRVPGKEDKAAAPAPAAKAPTEKKQ